MKIRELNQLNQETITEIKELVAQCNSHDGMDGMVTLDNSLNFNREANYVYMMLDENKLIAVLTLFMPGKNEAEISAMTLPEYRRRGCFKELVQKALTELKKYGVPELLFVCEGNSASGKAAIAKQQAEYEFTEYTLKYNNSLNDKINEYNYRIKLHQAGMQDIEHIAKISMDAFGDSYEGAKSLAMGALKAENRKVYLAELDGEFLAMGVTAVEDDSISINGLGVHSDYRGKGFGKEILYAIMREIVKNDFESIIIEVESENQNAFQLYKNSGFEVMVSSEYYRKAIE